MLKVLIVEDENLLRKGLVYTFDWTSVGCTVVGEAADGRIGLQMIRELSPDIVITDIRMPGLDGLEMIEAASKERSFCSILLTGYSEFQYAKQAVSLKVFEYLLKPVDTLKLEQTLRQAGEHIQHLKLIQSLEQNKASSMLADPDTFLCAGTKPNYYVEQALKLIKSNYKDALNIKEIAEQLQVSESYLSRKFKEETLNTFVEFLNKYRIKKSIEMLDQGGLRIFQVAEEVGFNEYKHFNNLFRRYMGLTPSEFSKSKIHIKMTPNQPEC